MTKTIRINVTEDEFLSGKEFILDEITYAYNTRYAYIQKQNLTGTWQFECFYFMHEKKVVRDIMSKRFRFKLIFKK